MENKEKINSNAYIELSKIEKNKFERKKNDPYLLRHVFILVIVLILLGIGFINYHSINVLSDNLLRKDIKYLIRLIVGVASGLFFYKYNYENFYRKSISKYIVILGIILFLIFSIPLDTIFPRINGGKGWINLGFINIQVTELFKIAFIIMVAEYFARGKINKKSDNDNLEYGYIFGGVLVIYIIFAILMTVVLNDLGTALHYGAIYAFMVYTTDLHDKFVALIISFVVFFGTIFAYIYYHMMSGYKAERLVSYVNGLFNGEYDAGAGYQVFQSLIAFGSGGINGKGYINGIQKYSYIPEITTDFAISTIAEEFGFVGMFIILLLFLGLFISIAAIAKNADNYFGKYLAIGIAGYIITQVIINISVAIGLLPVFGIPLPFISFGGSSILTIMSSIGLVLSINRNTKKSRKRAIK